MEGEEEEKEKGNKGEEEQDGVVMVVISPFLLTKYRNTIVKIK
jgi:hypothetical protein